MDSSKELIKTVDLLLDISSVLMVSGANTSRVNLSIDRFASALNFKASCFISHKSIIMTLYEEHTTLSCTRVKNIPPHAINFSIISAISKASWNAVEERWTLSQIEREIEIIKKQTRYPKLVVLMAVSLAGSGFCKIFNGDYFNMGVAFISTFIGLLIFQLTHKEKFNVYLRIYFASLIASIVAATGIIFHIGENPQTALATSILFLVPGVALINSFTDLLENNIINGMVRFTTGLMTVLAIALGLFITMLLFQLN
ncbi:threonine/serine ThrE exporter family protein [Confluentibacter sediminis]|uniref:threonine/serine ThrE exporter family protein n=1 Tax=Confluentibacter sediminis TaxID=2219045 RepID=UPI000DAED8B4|nr:threonine/serine exporter family protein [Confluentibacter sediminis]